MQYQPACFDKDSNIWQLLNIADLFLSSAFELVLTILNIVLHSIAMFSLFSKGKFLTESQ